MGVQEWIQKAEHGPPRLKEAIVQQRYDAREYGARAARAIDLKQFAPLHDQEVFPRGRDVGKAPACAVE